MTKDPIQFPTYNMAIGNAWAIFKCHLDNDTVPIQSKTLAIEKIARLETLNSVTKDELVHALRWLFDHYDFTH